MGDLREMRGQSAQRHRPLVRFPVQRVLGHALEDAARDGDLGVEFRENRLFHVHFLKSTLGSAFASAGTWKYGYSLNPNILAVTLEGNWRRSVSNSRTLSL